MSDHIQRNVICLKWGKRYPASYTNTLFRSVTKNLSYPVRFVCITDDPTGLDEGIDAQPIPPSPGYPEHMWPNIFLKLAVLKNGCANLQGPTLFLDVDIVIMDNIDCFFDYKPGEFCIIHNWIEWHKTIFKARPAIGNSSIFRFEAGKSDDIYQQFLKEFDKANDKKYFTTEQAFLTHAAHHVLGHVNWWPEEWSASYKRTCRPIFPLNLICAPKEPTTKVLVFHGNPDPDQAVNGFQDKKLHHRILPAPWISKYWKLSE